MASIPVEPSKRPHRPGTRPGRPGVPSGTSDRAKPVRGDNASRGRGQGRGGKVSSGQRIVSTGRRPKPVPVRKSIDQNAGNSGSAPFEPRPQNPLERIQSQFLGPLVRNPEKFGYTRFEHRKQETPDYMLQHDGQFESRPFYQNDWDRANQLRLLDLEKNHNGDIQPLFDQFREMREAERKEMERANLVDAENAKKTLTDALVFRGSCLDMCPVNERIERIHKKQVSKWEKDPVSGRISRERAVKTFVRPSGQPPPLPSDVRPPHILVKTLDYMIENLLQQLPESQSFIWDRTRSIRQDFTFQNNYSGPESVDCHERICRIHLLSLHIMAGANDPDYSQQQEIEQFTNSLQTLTHMYDDIRSRGGNCPNEAEFRAYEVLLNLKDTELDRKSQTLPTEVYHDKGFQRALMLRGMVMAQQRTPGSLNVYSVFFRAVYDHKTPLLAAFLCESHFNEIRFSALVSMARAYHSSSKAPLAVSISDCLGFFNVEEFFAFTNAYNLPQEQDPTGIRIKVNDMKASSFKNSMLQYFSPVLNQRLASTTPVQIVNSGVRSESVSLGNQQPSLTLPAGTDTPPFDFERMAQRGSIITPTVAHHTSAASQSVPPSSEPFVFAKQLQQTASTFDGNDGLTKKQSQHDLSDVQPKPTFTFGAPVPTTLPSSVPFQPAPTEITPSSHPPKPESAAPPKKLKITERTNFPSASKIVVQSMLHHLTKYSVNAICTEVLRSEAQHRQKTAQRDQLLDQFSKELLRAFVDEIVYQTTLEAMADDLRARFLKRRALKNIEAKARVSLTRKNYKDRKLQELETFTSRSTKVSVPVIRKKRERNPSLSSVATLPRKKATSEVKNRDSEPLDLKLMTDRLPFVGTASFLLIAKDWNSRESKHLRGIFSLVKTNNAYENTVTSQKGAVIKFTSLPDDFDTRQFFSSAGFVLFQFGLVDTAETSPERKLKGDRHVLIKAVSYLQKFSKFSSSILILVYNCESVGEEKINELLGVSSLEHLAHVARIQVLKMNSGENEDLIKPALEDMLKSLHLRHTVREDHSISSISSSSSTKENSYVNMLTKSQQDKRKKKLAHIRSSLAPSIPRLRTSRSLTGGILQSIGRKFSGVPKSPLHTSFTGVLSTSTPIASRSRTFSNMSTSTHANSSIGSGIVKRVSDLNFGENNDIAEKIRELKELTASVLKRRK
ncbi:unnamed protein product [Kuraishia capsulata CBS 1993]|uniref:Nuclear mRNA export factor n=1 Tax=Kuraishia capsulata CBS 1993 TaxID=1382522 RepID=W6MNL1_9ASCO|nr:uncharacterized protein KUCA_T00004198001 [Kuraishia capsulata CBS 1993]CDK28216.1 unnamed protein product [Kuraishia capsulata CBS 1993]